MAKKRTDAERRARQCERLGRLLCLLKLLMGGGRWDLPALATELGCSTRTVQRMLTTLTAADVPWFYDEREKAYRVRPGFKFGDLKALSIKDAGDPSSSQLLPRKSLSAMLAETQKLVGSLQHFCEQIERQLRLE